MAVSTKMMVQAAALAMVVVFLATGTDGAGSCGLKLDSLQGCLPSVPKPKVKAPCCKIMKGIDWSCLCLMEMPGFFKTQFDPMFAFNIAYGCNYVTPGICV